MHFPVTHLFAVRFNSQQIEQWNYSKWLSLLQSRLHQITRYGNPIRSQVSEQWTSIRHDLPFRYDSASAFHILSHWTENDSGNEETASNSRGFRTHSRHSTLWALLRRFDACSCRHDNIFAWFLSSEAPRTHSLYHKEQMADRESKLNC